MYDDELVGFIRGMGVGVDIGGHTMSGPASVRDAHVIVQLVVHIQWILLWLNDITQGLYLTHLFDQCGGFLDRVDTDTCAKTLLKTQDKRIICDRWVK